MPAIREAVTSSRRKVVVLDNDPTGTQTVHEIPVLTDWSVESLCGKQGVGGEVDLERAVRRPPGPAAEPDQTELRTFTIITTAPNPVVGAYHDRMPVILPRNDHERWLDPA